MVSYVATGRHRGRFCHLAPDGSAGFIELPNTYSRELSLERRTIILKLHGGSTRRRSANGRASSSPRTTTSTTSPARTCRPPFPSRLAAKLRRSHFLFLGYAMSDWNLRIVLNRLWGEQPLSYRSWAIQPEAKAFEREFWRRRDVDVLELPLDEYVRCSTGRHARKAG